MINYNPPLSDIRFIIYEVFDVSSQWTTWPEIQSRLDRETANAILEEGAKLASRTIAPLNRAGDEEGCHWKDGKVRTPDGYKQAYNLFAAGGWTGLNGNPSYGGMGMPKVLSAQHDEMMCSASLAFTLYPSLTAGACLTIDAYAANSLKQLFLPKMYTGEWSGTMCLTEPHAGSDLGIITTKAEPSNNGSYSISGTKIFITNGEHDLTNNIIHLVLARLPNSPQGSKGISLFLVPKMIVNQDGTMGKANNVSCGSIEHKMGINASATCVMNFDKAVGYLIGEPHEGLKAMFTMMNYERLVVGIQALGGSEMSYQIALDYAKQRLQGRSAAGPAQKDKLADPLTVHGDVRRMLMNMKALTEGGRAFSTYVAQQLDIAKFSSNPSERNHAADLAALLTPVVKAFITDTCFENCITGQQVLGGHGYIREWGQEQLVRDVRITQIYEGTNGIQAQDLLMRKITLNNSRILNIFLQEIRSSVTPENEFFEPLLKTIGELEALTESIMSQAKTNPNIINSACVDYLNAFGYMSYAWVWALMGQIAKEKIKLGEPNKDFYQVKLNTSRYYFKRLLPRFRTYAATAVSGTKELFSSTEEQF